MDLFLIAEEFNSILIDVLKLFPFLFVIIFDALFIIGGILVLAEYINDWFKKFKRGTK